MLSTLLSLVLLWLHAISCCSAVVSARNPSSIACNNSPDLCSRTYDNITHLGAHESAFVRDASTSYSDAGNQYYNATVALSAGIRLLSAQVHDNNGAWHICHTSCVLLDAGLLSEWLAKIKSWMDENPHDVVTILLVNSDDASAEDLDREFTNSGITKYAYTPSSISAMATWPTLSTLISDGTRLMTFIASLPSSSDYAYLMDEFTYMWENPYDVTSLTNFSCVPDRPTDVRGSITEALNSNRLSLMNHFMYSTEAFGVEEPNIINISTTNSPSTTVTGALGKTADECRDKYSRAPTFVLVDFFDEGPAMETIDRLNGVLNNTTGRTNPSSSSSDSSNAFDMLAGIRTLKKVLHHSNSPAAGAWIWACGYWGTIGTIYL